MSTFLWIVIVIIAFFGGLVGGTFIARKQMEKYLEENPPLNADVIRTMMSQMGQKPSEAKVQQVVRQMNKQQQAAKTKAKKK
ncbi:MULTISPECIES: YneF family protein [unclassified Streptococcus]|uniref:YneF family protein n=1 Tax=unclassified Streptococcus TaxID=2608887 RepID=UPI0011B5384A|nr:MULTISPECIES: YneF family protein [unclassified Streptococcus]TWS94874.1 YneF family protein [Streptococcus sp. sy018]TWT11250.1 YneF family protein [Streptococcus sp. sy004]TWT16232.1 YneF family protein [Streptococcus sp. sy010]